MSQPFSTWIRWIERNQLGETLKFPGVYAIALSDKDLTSTPFEWSEEIIYIGMTNAKGGLKSRLQQFENTIIGKTGHGGAERFAFSKPPENSRQRLGLRQPSGAFASHGFTRFNHCTRIGPQRFPRSPIGTHLKFICHRNPVRLEPVNGFYYRR